MKRFTNLLKAAVVLSAVVAIAMLLPLQLHAQTFFGSIVGSVTDSSNAVVPNASVTITNLGTNESQSIKSGAAGEYRFVNLVPASYKVTVEAPNYKRIVRQPVTVAVDNTTRVDVTLQVGATSETVEVTTQEPLLQTDSGTLGTQVEGKTVTEMPLNGRNALNLMALAPGVIPGNNAMGGAAMNNGPGNNSHTTATWNTFIISGGQAGQNAEYFDGVTMDSLGNSPTLVPTQDAIQEFKMATSSVSAEFGHYSGGVMELTSKSGSNQWHGSAYEYVRNNKFNANSFFNNGFNGSKGNRPEWNQNQFGAIVSGPALKDKLFFMFSWEHFVARLGQTQITNVPDANMQNGIVYGKAATSTAAAVPIYSNPIAQALCPSMTLGTSVQVNGNTYTTTTIPQSCWDVTAKVLKGAYPTPNQSGVAVGGNNWLSNPVVGDSQNQYNARVDWAIGSNQRFFAHWAYWPLQDMPMDIFKSYGGFKTGNGYTKASSHLGVVGDTYTINPTTIVDVRLGFMRFNNFSMPQNGGNIDESQFGSNWAALASQMSYKEYPGIHISGGQWNLYDFHPFDDTNQNHFNSYSIAASVTKIAGAQTLKAGMELRLMDQNQFGLGSMDPSGWFDFTTNNFADNWAAFLLGFADDSYIHTAKRLGAYQYSEGFYVTDDWTVSRKLTLNLGLRYDLPGGVSERHDSSTVLLPNTLDPNTGLTGTLALVNSSLYSSRATQYGTHSEFQPRTGFAYRLRNDTTIRGGFGLAFTPVNVTVGGGGNPTGSTVGTAMTGWTNPSATTVSASNPFILLANPYPTSLYPNGINQPVGHSNAAFMKNYVKQAKLQTMSGPIPTEPYSYVEQWNLAVGQQLKGNLMVEAAYVGSKGTHLPTNGTIGINELAPSHWSETNLSSSATCAGVLNANTVAQCERPYPAYQNLSNTMANHSSSTYHSLQVRTEKRFSGGSLVSGNYTWSKGISDSDEFSNTSQPAPQDYYNLKADRAIVGANTPNRAVISYVLNLPFGKGQRFGSGVHGVGGAIISGWSVNGITTFASGWPLALTSNAGTLFNNYGAGTLRPNYIAGCSKAGSGSRYQRVVSKQWFNTACFPGYGQTGGPTDIGVVGAAPLGNQVKLDDKLRQDHQDNWDITFAKSTAVRESMNMVFKAELFNAFNRTQFQAPGTNVGGSRQAGAFGQTLNAGFPRLVQLSLRLNF